RAVAFDLEAVDDDLDEVLDAAVELEVVGEPHYLTVHPGADEAALEHVFKKVFVFSFLPPDDGGQDEEACAGRQGLDAGDDLFARLRGNGPAALRTMALSHAGV